jgi:hypothetical protein
MPTPPFRVTLTQDFPVSLDGVNVVVLEPGTYVVPDRLPLWHAQAAIRLGYGVDPDAIVPEPVPADSPDGEFESEPENEATPETLEAPAAPRTRGRPPRR